MTIHSGGRDLSLCFMTATWGPDLGHFRWLRRSMERAGFADIPHFVVVQTEDLPLFKSLESGGMRLLSTAEVLPGDIERRRVDARRRTQDYGRRLGKFCTSLNKRFGWCDWVRYTGWQVQQITKLTVAASVAYELTVVLDSDLLLTRPFDLRLFVPDGRATVFEHPDVTPQTRGLAWRWHETACRLLLQSAVPPANSYVGTPFVLDRSTLIALHGHIELIYGRPWFETLLALPVSAWSEFATYNVFARRLVAAPSLEFRANPHVRGLDNAYGAARAEAIIRAAIADPRVYFLYIPSVRFARRRWAIQDYDPLLRELLN